MTPRQEKAVAVARDVITQVNKPNNGYEVVCGSYFTTEYDLSEATGDLRDHLDAIQCNYCQVCALGSVFLSKVRLYNHAPVSEVVDDDSYIGRSTMVNLLQDVFTSDNLDLIESAFEQSYFSTRVDSQLVGRAINFGDNYDDDQDRLVAIMQNVIDNNGEFVP